LISSYFLFFHLLIHIFLSCFQLSLSIGFVVICSQVEHFHADGSCAIALRGQPDILRCDAEKIVLLLLFYSTFVVVVVVVVAVVVLLLLLLLLSSSSLSLLLLLLLLLPVLLLLLLLLFVVVVVVGCCCCCCLLSFLYLLFLILLFVMHSFISLVLIVKLSFSFVSYLCFFVLHSSSDFLLCFVLALILPHCLVPICPCVSPQILRLLSMLVVDMGEEEV
jgi:hypothetical protein